MVAKKLFGRQQPSAPPSPGIDTAQLNNRLSLVEEKITHLNKKFEVLEKNMVDHFKRTNSEFQSYDSGLMEVKREINDLKQKFDLVVKELKMTAGKDELNTLKKYLDLWKPVKFVTQEQVEKIVEEKLQKNL